MTSKNQIDMIVSKLISEIESRPLRGQMSTDQADKITIECDPNKNAWLKAIYAANLVEASKLTALLSDKILQRRIFEHYLGDQADHFMLRSIGLKEFVFKYHLADAEGQLIPNTDNFEEALALEFPNGFVVRPALGVAPLERNHGLFATNDDFLKEIFKPTNSLYQANTLHRKIKSHIINAVASGEAIILQEDIVHSSHTKQRLKNKVYERIRLHSYESRLIEGAIPELWANKRNFAIGETETKSVETFVADFLKALPPRLMTRQAWSIDVGLLDNGEVKILDIVTNRGAKSFWSSYLDEPRILGAYTRHFQENLDVEFKGLNGLIFRANLANYINYWDLKKERSKRFGNPEILSSLPPWPF